LGYNLTHVTGSVQNKSKTIGTVNYLKHLALISEATEPRLRVAAHETLNTKSSAIELM